MRDIELNRLLVGRTLDDATTIATIHVHAWQTACQGIVQSAVLDALSVKQREAFWRRNLERRTSEMWVADDGGHVVGWISAGVVMRMLYRLHVKCGPSWLVVS